jgi:class 3 adenylate cyclase
VMATFPSASAGLSAALAMRDAMDRFNTSRGREELMVKIGLHEGPCLAVVVNDRVDYFGQTVNVAARVQGLATSRAIYATEPVVTDAGTKRLLDSRRLEARPERAALKGVREEVTVFQIP